MRREIQLSLIALSSLASTTVPIANASTYTGYILGVESQPSPTTSGNVRVSILVSGTTSCTGVGGNWYSYDLPAGPTAGMYGATLLAVFTSGGQVLIGGTGTCDPYGIETVAYIRAQ